jgi:hypothetical protein
MLQAEFWMDRCQKIARSTTIDREREPNLDPALDPARAFLAVFSAVDIQVTTFPR